MEVWGKYLENGDGDERDLSIAAIVSVEVRCFWVGPRIELELSEIAGECCGDLWRDEGDF